MADTPILSIEKMKISIKKSGNVIVDYSSENDVPFVVKPGEIVLLIGENGSGKSSIFKSILDDYDRIELDVKKQIFFCGNELKSIDDIDDFRLSIGYASQEDEVDSFFESRVWPRSYRYALNSKSVLDGQCSKKDAENHLEELYDYFECSRYDKEHNSYKKRKLTKCSGGERKMASILTALGRTDARLYILDEPINNLDAHHARLLNNYLIDLVNKENPPGVLIITHCHMFTKARAYKLDNGKIIAYPDYECHNSCFGIYDNVTGKYAIREESKK